MKMFINNLTLQYRLVREIICSREVSLDIQIII